MTNLFEPAYTRPLLDVVTELTDNKDLQTIFMYCWGDYGCPPSKTTFIMQALLNRHFMRGGAHYPVGGSSEIAYNIIPVIERGGGRLRLTWSNSSKIDAVTKPILRNNSCYHLSSDLDPMYF